MKITLIVNGKTTDVEVDDPSMPLLYALRDGLASRGPRLAAVWRNAGPVPTRRDS